MLATMKGKRIIKKISMIKDGMGLASKMNRVEQYFLASQWCCANQTLFQVRKVARYFKASTIDNIRA